MALERENEGREGRNSGRARAGNWEETGEGSGTNRQEEEL
jgi:hypothetical protein